MITEKDRILALILMCSNGPVEGQAERAGWSPQMVTYGNRVLEALAKKIRQGFHHQIPDALVKRVLAGDFNGE